MKMEGRGGGGVSVGKLLFSRLSNICGQMEREKAQRRYDVHINTNN